MGAILDAAGYSNVLTKVVGSNNANNVVKGCNGRILARLESPEMYAARLGRKADEFMDGYTVGPASGVAAILTPLTLKEGWHAKAESHLEEEPYW